MPSDATPSNPDFQVGTLYPAAEIQGMLNVGNAGGVRLCLADNGDVKRLVLMTSVPSARQQKENPYHDRLEGDTLIYTGAGREGDQTLAGMNKRIPQQQDHIFPLYAFRLVASRRDKTRGPKRWEFVGLLEYLRHYPESQFDSRGVPRQVWLFELRVHRVSVRVATEESLAKEIIEKSREQARINREDRIVVGHPSSSEAPDLSEKARGIEKIRMALLALHPERFEHLVKEALIVLGFERVAVTKFSQDGGVDVMAVVGKAIWPLSELFIQIQAKRWLHTVGRKEIAELRGSLQPFARGAVVTTSHFSKAAITEASEDGKLPIVLVDGFRFASLLITHKAILDAFGLRS